MALSRTTASKVFYGVIGIPRTMMVGLGNAINFVAKPIVDAKSPSVTLWYYTWTGASIGFFAGELLGSLYGLIIFENPEVAITPLGEIARQWRFNGTMAGGIAGFIGGFVAQIQENVTRRMYKGKEVSLREIWDQYSIHIRAETNRNGIGLSMGYMLLMVPIMVPLGSEMQERDAQIFKFAAKYVANYPGCQVTYKPEKFCEMIACANQTAKATVCAATESYVRNQFSLWNFRAGQMIMATIPAAMGICFFKAVRDVKRFMEYEDLQKEQSRSAVAVKR